MSALNILCNFLYPVSVFISESIFVPLLVHFEKLKKKMINWNSKWKKDVHNVSRIPQTMFLNDTYLIRVKIVEVMIKRVNGVHFCMLYFSIIPWYKECFGLSNKDLAFFFSRQWVYWFLHF